MSTLPQVIIPTSPSVIVAADVSTLEELEKLVRSTSSVRGISGYKVGFNLALGYGLPKVVDTIKSLAHYSVVIYDHQKAGTDIPDLGKQFAKRARDSHVDAVIFFPQAGPATQKAWVFAAQDENLGVIVGGEMTHPQYKVSDGGYIDDSALDKMYRHAALCGVNNFVVPGNKPDRVDFYRRMLTDGQSVKGLTLYAPGFVTQGGVISDTAKVAGDRWHAIVGSAIYKAPDINEAARQMTSQLFS